MFRPSVPRLRAATSSMARPKIGPRPHNFAPALAMPPTVLAGPAPKLSDTSSRSSSRRALFTHKRNMYTDADTETKLDSDPDPDPDPDPDTDSDSDFNPDLQVTLRRDRHEYFNRYKEEILFSGDKPPKGYEFVPTGNIFLTAYCRKHSRKHSRVVYAFFSPTHRKGRSKQTGIYVPGEIARKAKAEQKAKMAAADETILRRLEKHYPAMPPDVRDEMHSALSWSSDGYVTGPSLEGIHRAVKRLVWERYSPFRQDRHDIPPPNTEMGIAYARSCARVEKVLDSYRGKKSSKGKVRK
ncbi:hypothetical protein F5X96DRAFT_629433 [Biscogniauxia mediterranea]|nr:hypothetical protein F5X96DRAFT_629433 [Biscogniauxia mediterranea]